MSENKIWRNCVWAILLLQVVLGCGFIGLYFGVKVLGINHEAIKILFLTLIIGYAIFSCYAIYAGKESLNKYYDYAKACEEMKKEGCKLSERLLELISTKISLESVIPKDLLKKEQLFCLELWLKNAEDHG